MKAQETTNLWAVIPSKQRIKSLSKLANRLILDNVNVVVIDTGYSKKLKLDEELQCLHVIRDTEPINISRWWNVGLNFIKGWNAGIGYNKEYYVAILNDDIEAPENLVRDLATAMETDKTVAAFPDIHNVGPGILTQREPTSVFHRMQGYAFCLRGSANLKADEDFVWWCGDDDLDWAARGAGGVSRVANISVKHRVAEDDWAITNPELQEQTAKDMQHFVDKWGMRPW